MELGSGGQDVGLSRLFFLSFLAIHLLVCMIITQYIGTLCTRKSMSLLKQTAFACRARPGGVIFFIFFPGEQIHDAMCIYLLIHAYLSERHSRRNVVKAGGFFHSPLVSTVSTGEKKKKEKQLFLSCTQGCVNYPTA